MADELSTIPTKSTSHTAMESDVMNQFFPPEKASEGTLNSWSWSELAKFAGYATILFVALANPWIDVLICNVPYCGESPLVLLGIKAVLYFVFFILIYKLLNSSKISSKSK